MRRKMTNSSDARINIRVTQEYKDKVTKYTRENNISLTDLVTQGIESIMYRPDIEAKNKDNKLELLVTALAHNMESVMKEIKELRVKSSA